MTRTPTRRAVAFGLALEGDLETFLASRSASPAPHSTTVTRLVEVGVEVEVVELDRTAEPVGVDVHQGRTADERRVHPGDDERR